MGGVAKAVTSTVESAVSTVGNAVQDVGDFIVDDVVKPVAKAVDNTIKAAANDPLNTAIRVGAFVVGGPAGLAIANGTIALAQGQSLGDAAMLAGKTYIIGQAGAAAGQAAGAAATEAGYGVAASNVAQGATSGLTRAGLSGGNLEQGAIMGALGGANRTAAQEISDQQLDNWSQEQAARAYENSPSPTEQDVLAADPSIKMEFPAATQSEATGPGYYDEVTGKFIPAENGNLQSPLTDASGTNTMPDNGMPAGDTSNVAGQSGSDLTSGQGGYTPGSYDPMLTVNQMTQGLNFVENAILNGNKSGAGTVRGLQPVGSTGLQMPKLGGTSQDVGPKLMAGDTLAGESTGDPYYLQHLKQLYSSLTPDLQQALATNNGNSSMPIGANFASSAIPVESPLTMASGGSTASDTPYAQAITGVSKGPLIGGGQRKIAQMTPLAQLKQQIGQPRMAKGGLSLSHPDIPKGHNPEFITGQTGYYASGRGTGQSDDIPAVLRHGDYVMDADTVAAFGDGSSKAGAHALEKFRKHLPVRASSGGKIIPAQIADGEYVLPEAFVTALGQGDNARGAKILDGMRKNLREHKRSAPTSKIPPKAKSPLEYIKMGMKG